MVIKIILFYDEEKSDLVFSIYFLTQSTKLSIKDDSAVNKLNVDKIY